MTAKNDGIGLSDSIHTSKIQAQKSRAPKCVPWMPEGQARQWRRLTESDFIDTQGTHTLIIPYRRGAVNPARSRRVCGLRVHCRKVRLDFAD